MTDAAPAPESTDAPATDAPTAPEGAPEPDSIEALRAELESLKSHSRKWEDRAKENYEAKKELDTLKRAQMTEAEKAQADAAEIEKRVQEAENARLAAEAELVRTKVAIEFGLSKEDADALASVSDEAALRALAERLAGRSTGPRPLPAQGRRPGSASLSPADAFADAMSELF